MYKLLIVSHSINLAKSIKDFCISMLPNNQDMEIDYVAGDEQNNLGNSLLKIKKAIEKDYDKYQAIFLIYDIGSSKMIVDAIKSEYVQKLIVVNAPILEGSFVAYAFGKKDMSVKQIKDEIEKQSKIK